MLKTTTPYKFAGATPNEIHCLSGVHTNIQHQFDAINAVNDTSFKVVNGLIELPEDITVEGSNEDGDAYIFAATTPADITTLKGVRSSVQGQFDEVNGINAELD